MFFQGRLIYKTPTTINERCFIVIRILYYSLYITLDVLQMHRIVPDEIPK